MNVAMWKLLRCVNTLWIKEDLNCRPSRGPDQNKAIVYIYSICNTLGYYNMTMVTLLPI